MTLIVYMEYTEERLSYCVKEWTKTKISPKFEFREHQLECIVRILQNILEHKYQNYIVQAPTGSGKSLINMIAAGVLAEYFDITSYILVSDLFLWEQYETFLNKYKHTGIASIKGQTGNYVCKLNGEDIRNSDCRMAGLAWSSLFNESTRKEYGYDCALNCPYVKARKKAVKAKVVVMTYQLFLFVMNNPLFNQDSHGKPIFLPHDVLFCDECHNIPEIIQLKFAPTIVTEDFNKLEELYNNPYYNSKELDLFKDNSKEVIGDELNDNNDLLIYNQFSSVDDMKIELEKLWKVWICKESRKDEDIDALNNYMKILGGFKDVCTTIENTLSLKKQNKQPYTEDDVHYYKLCSWFRNMCCHLNDFSVAIERVGNEYELKDINIENKTNKISVAFKCTREDFITWYFLLSHANYKVMVSATIGDKDAYDERMGFCYETSKGFEHENAIINESYLEFLPSTFDFEKSPVYFLDKFKMSFREREVSFIHLKTAIYSICKTKFAGQKGMIQTGSYEFAKRLFDDAPFEIKQRMLLYSGSREKHSIVQLHQISGDTILVGPTLNTGVDLPGEDCRFIIILKVPYPSLMDRLTNERNKLYPLWYNWHTSNEIIQGIGRGVRFNGDWCVTYIFDACFKNLYLSTKNQYPKELQDRIKTI